MQTPPLFTGLPFHGTSASETRRSPGGRGAARGGRGLRAAAPWATAAPSLWKPPKAKASAGRVGNRGAAVEKWWARSSELADRERSVEKETMG